MKINNKFKIIFRKMNLERLKKSATVVYFIYFFHSCSVYNSPFVQQHEEPNIIPMSNSIAVSKGSSMSCITTSLGIVKCFGLRGYSNSFLDLTTRGIPTFISDTSDYSKINVGSDSACGITSSGVLKCWGNNSDGQLGDGTTTIRRNPTVIDSGTSYAIVSVGRTNTCGLKTSGIYKCWGSNTYGQLDDGTTTERLTTTLVLNP